jgi:hypothetical protein
MGAASLGNLFDSRYYENLDGGILEAFGRLFRRNVRIYVYPLKDGETGELTTSSNYVPPDELCDLYAYLMRLGRLEQLRNYRPDVLHIFSRDVLNRIRAGDDSWEAMVPDSVASAIHERGFFGWPPPTGSKTTAKSTKRPAKRNGKAERRRR